MFTGYKTMYSVRKTLISSLPTSSSILVQNLLTKNSIGYMIFIANIMQFGTSQLREASLQNSVIFLCWYFWVSGISNLISFSLH